MSATDLSDPARDQCRQRLYGAYVSSGQAGPGDAAVPTVHPGVAAYLHAVIDRHLPKDRSLRIVDLACGHGSLVQCLRDQGYLDVKGYDLSHEQVALAERMRIPGIEHKDMNAALAGERDSLDAVFMMDVLEHLTTPELLATLDRLRAALKPGGLVIAHVPNAEGLHGMRIRYGDLTHEQCFTANSLRQAFKVCGFASVACFEDKPVVHGAMSLVRRVLWALTTAPARLRLLAETGSRGHILSQNLLAVARR